VQSRYSPFAARLIPTLFLSALGLWFAITRSADFLIGGNIRRPYKRNRVIFVDATGWDAVAIGCVFIALGIINLALGIPDPRRIPVFWNGGGPSNRDDSLRLWEGRDRGCVAVRVERPVGVRGVTRRAGRTGSRRILIA
jgi:hypothetical protein